MKITEKTIVRIVDLTEQGKLTWIYSIVYDGDNDFREIFTCNEIDTIEVRNLIYDSSGSSTLSLSWASSPFIFYYQEDNSSKVFMLRGPIVKHLWGVIKSVTVIPEPENTELDDKLKVIEENSKNDK